VEAVPKLLLIDNYDSFTYNVVQALRSLGAQVTVVLHDAEPVDALLARDPDGVVLSPGPGSPDEAGVCLEAVRAFEGKAPILGICLGHQVIAQRYGATITRAERIFHGHATPIHHAGEGVLHGLPSPFSATRYHSLVVDPGSLPDTLEVTARSSNGTIMGLRHRTLPVEGVQFHPESFLTTEGQRLFSNFVKRVRESA
jgi:anthranilate synthase component 2